MLMGSPAGGHSPQKQAGASYKSNGATNGSPSKKDLMARIILNQSPNLGGNNTMTSGTLNYPRFSALPLSPAAGLGGQGADIPLRDPLDIEFKLNRKLAKQLYEREMQERAKNNLQNQQLAREQEVAGRLKKEQDKLKKQEEQL